MKKITITNISLGLLGLLMAAFAVFMVDRGNSVAWPSITNNRPSGLMAFAELLRRDGYEVAMERSGSPKLGKDDLAICPNIVQTESQWDILTSDDEDEGSGGAPLDGQAPSVGADDPPLVGSLKKHLKDGGSILYLPIPHWFEDQSKIVAKDQDVRSMDSTRAGKVSLGDINRINEKRPEWTKGDTEAIVWQTVNQIPVTRVATFGAAKVGLVADGLMATNRHLDESDNARLLLGLVRSTAKPGARVVFVESMFGNSEEEGLFAAIGPWASAARWQMIILLAVVVFTLGKRFGLPDVEHPIERGARDMLVAVSATLRTNKRDNLALTTIAGEAVERARRILRLPPSTEEKDILDRVPEGLAMAVRNVRLRDVTTRPMRTLEHAQLIQRELRAFEQDSRERKDRR
jgi:hypothetical protein